MCAPFSWEETDERPGDRPLGAAVGHRVRRVRGGRWVVVSPPPWRAVRGRRLLRLLAQPARPGSRRVRRSPGGAQLRTGRGLVLGLLDRAAGGRGGPRAAREPPRRPARTRTARPGAGRLAVPTALIPARGRVFPRRGPWTRPLLAVTPRQLPRCRRRRARCSAARSRPSWHS